MGYRREKRMTQVEKNVDVAECDVCGATQEVPADEAFSRPPDWFSIGQGLTLAGIFCSKACVGKWAAADGLTSAEATDIARQAFKATSG